MAMQHKIRSANDSRLPDLFDAGEPDIALTPAQKTQMASLVEALLIEIARHLATREAGHEQDHL